MLQTTWKRKIALFWRGWGWSLVIAILIATSFRSAIADWNDVPTGSMKPHHFRGRPNFCQQTRLRSESAIYYVASGEMG